MKLRLRYKDHTGNSNATANIVLPASKSIANRLLVIRHLYAKSLNITNLSDANDTQLLQRNLHQLSQTIDIEDAGTACRFMVAVLSITPGSYSLTGTERMKQRPIGQLVEALQQLGADITYQDRTPFLPLGINGKSLKGGDIIISDPGSSQFISALMLIAPLMPDGLTIHIKGRLLSAPYVQMTALLMQNLGFKVSADHSRITVLPFIPNVFPEEYRVESDWSAAAFFYALAALLPEKGICLQQLESNTIQGDGQYLLQHDLPAQHTDKGILIHASGHPPFATDIDCAGIPDLALPLIVRNALLGLHSRFSGLETLKSKESDRTAALAAELSKAGIRFYPDGESWMLDPSNLRLPENMIVDSYGDHRMAMALSIFATRTNVTISDAGVVKKSFPLYWQQLESLNFAIETV